MKLVRSLSLSIMLSALPLALFAADATPASAMQATKVGVVSARSCVEQSKDGHLARETLESVSKNMTKSLEDLNRQLEEISNKLSDEDVRDTLTPEAEKALQDQFDSLSQEHEMKRMQFSQQMNQAQMAAMQQLFDRMNQASQKVASELGLDLIMQEDSALYFAPKLDVTDKVIAAMNKANEEAAAQKAATSETKQEPAKEPVKDTKAPAKDAKNR